MALQAIPTMLVGSYPQPVWLVDKEILLSFGSPRVRMEKVWRVLGALLEGAQDVRPCMIRSALDWISSPMARPAARVFSTVSPMRSKGSISRRLASCRAEMASRRKYPALWARLAGRGRFRCAMWNFCAVTRTDRSRLPSPVLSRWRSWHSTNIRAIRNH